MDTNGDGVVDELDTQTPAETTEATGNASSADEIQMDTNGDGVVDELDTQTPAETTEATGNASSADEIQMDTNGDGVVDELESQVMERLSLRPFVEFQSNICITRLWLWFCAPTKVRNHYYS